MMKKILFMLLFTGCGLAQGAEVIECQTHQLMFEIESYYREGNEEKPCPQNDDYPQMGTEFIHFNGKGVAMFSSGPSRSYCVGSSDTAPSPAIFRGCVDKGQIAKGVNRIHVGISNVSDSAYVNVTQRVYLFSGASRIFVTSFSRQGKGSDQVFSGPTDVELSAFILSESGVESAQKLQNIQAILDRLGELQVLSSKELAKWSEALSSYLEMDARHIDIASLGDTVPSWFKDLLKDLQQGQEKLNRDLADESKRIEDAQNTNQKKIADALQSLDSKISDQELSEELKLDDSGYEDEQLKQREHNWLLKFQADIDASKRVEFLQDVYAWEEESKVSLDTAIRLNAEIPGYYPAFVASQERILTFIQKYIDENYYFRDVAVSDAFKSLVENSLKLKNPDLAKHIKETINLKYKKSAKADKAVGHLEVIASEYVKGADSLSEGAQTALINDILSFISVAETAVECIVKTQAAGLYASFYEIFEGRNFCNDSELDWFDRTISFADFSADISSKLGFKMASGINLAISLKKMFSIAAPLFRKIGVNKITELSKVILEAAEKIKFSSLENFLNSIKGIFSSAKKSKLDMSDVGKLGDNAADYLRLKTHLKFMEDGILDPTGNLTSLATKESKLLLKGTDLNNPSVIMELTRDGSSIADWGKFTTKAVNTSSGQKLQVHFYQNTKTGSINYNIDFKVKQVVEP